MILSCFNWFDQRRQIILALIEAGPQAVTKGTSEWLAPVSDAEYAQLPARN